MRGTILSIDKAEKIGLISTDGGRFHFNFEEFKSPLSELKKGVEIDFESNDNESAQAIYTVIFDVDENIPYYIDQPKGFTSLFSAKGCYTRWQYWKITLITFSLYALYFIIIGFFNANTNSGEYSKDVIGVIGLFGIILLLPLVYINIVTSIKRFHDINLSGWFYLLNIIPYIGGLITLIMNGFLPSVKPYNRFCKRKNN